MSEDQRAFLGAHGGIPERTEGEIGSLRLAAQMSLVVHPMPDGDRGSVECRRCASVAMIHSLDVEVIWQAALRHLNECPTPHEEPPPVWRDMVRGDRDREEAIAALRAVLNELPAEFSEGPPDGRTRSQFRVIKRSNVERVHAGLWILQRHFEIEPEDAEVRVDT